MEKFNYLGSIVQNNEEILESVAYRITCGWMMWRKATGILCSIKSTIKDETSFIRLL